MRRLLILGAGTAGTMAANVLHRRLDDDWEVTVVEPSGAHLYQPGLLFLPFGRYDTADLKRPTHSTLHQGIHRVRGEVERVVPEADTVELTDGRRLPYDELVIATGTTPRPDQTPGMLDGGEWHRSVHEFYTLPGALALREALRGFHGGRLLVHITEMPIKCPVAPLEFTFLADAFFDDLGIRDRVDITYVTPLSAAFTQPVAARELGHMLERRGIALETDFVVERVDAERKRLVSFDERELPFDLLVTVPLNMGADFVARSGLGDELHYVHVDRHTSQSPDWPNVWALGDAADLPTSKAGSVAHFSVEVFVENFLQHVAGEPMTHAFDGHANCYVESGHGKAMLIDFNYDTQPLTGTYPVPRVGPFRLLEETRVNHLGKLAFRHLYWNVLLPGRPLPLPAHMSMAGKHPEPSHETVEV
ncbi:type III sulfide quinone reductase, selenoprotein subtype [Aquipuribacter nitratireducens]|uniref:NAD(P)/FAD-dependent oxidoreductase n=1 Tax=Aquipuribacter nitratireducens TaxID=650104 RepID=A0ABW0GH70_9MICO